MIANPQTIVPGTLMPRVVMTDATRELIANYLLQPDGALTQIPTTPVQARQATPLTGDGPALYTRFCVPCHGASGGGDGPNAPFLAVRPAVHDSQESMSARSDDALFDTIFSGGAVMNRSPRMPGYGATLTRGQIWTLVRHIRTLCRCEGPAWSRDSAR
jgi:mono/diheme cytochrome c family protein